MRLAQTLAKAAVILAIIAATLGGAVALGSTLFDSPPRDAAEFAARIEDGSTHAAPPAKLNPGERRYLLDAADLCVERNERIREHERAVSAADQVGRLRGWRSIQADHTASFEALAAPKRLRDTAARAAALDRGKLDLADSALAARKAGDRDGFAAKIEGLGLLDERYDQAVHQLGVPVCATG